MSFKNKSLFVKLVRVLFSLLLLPGSRCNRFQTFGMGIHLTSQDFRNALIFVSPPTGHTQAVDEDVVLRGSTTSPQLKSQFQTWEGGKIPYTLDLSFDVVERAEIAKAVLKIQKLTCIQFVPRFVEPDFVHVQKRLEGQGFCASLVGRMGGQQPLYLTARCVHEGIILHEVMHVIGFEHEHCRVDRDDYVNVTFSNIAQNAQYNFMKIPSPRLNYAGPYDIGSITHYSSIAFGKTPGIRTMVPKDSSNEKLMGQREGLSSLDQLKINNFYNCTQPQNQNKYPGFNTIRKRK